MIEEWRPTVREGYEVSNLGRVRSKKFGYYKILQGSYPRERYKQICTWNIGKPSGNLVHRMVAHAFIGPCPKDYQVNHKNGIKTDNRVENLEYVTPSQNQFHSCRILGNNRGYKNNKTKLSIKDIKEIRNKKSLGFKQKIIAKMYGVSEFNISSIIRRKTWTWL